jgi:hypothetical protein
MVVQAYFVTSNGLCRKSGLPDALFTNPKSRFGQILEGLAMEGAGMVHVTLVCFMAIWYILWPFGVFYVFILSFPRFGRYVVQRKIWQPVENYDRLLNLEPGFFIHTMTFSIQCTLLSPESPSL